MTTEIDLEGVREALRKLGEHYIRTASTALAAFADALAAPAREDAAPSPKTPLCWHYDDNGRMFCDDCGKEVYAFKEGEICSGCERVPEEAT